MIYRNFLLSLFIGFILAASPVLGQRGITYEQLANQQRQQSLFIDSFTLPGTNPGTLRYVTTFRIDYNLLPFRKYDGSETERNFFSPVGMSIELFRNPEGTPNNNRRRDDFSVEGLVPADRSFWRDTAFAENYQQTKSKNKFISGRLISELSPGTYSYILQFTRGDEVDGQTSRRRTVRVTPFESRNKGHVILAEKVHTEDDSGLLTAQLLNFGENVFYGRDFNALVHLPGYSSDTRYRLTVDRVSLSERDTTRQETVYQADLQTDAIHTGVTPDLKPGEGPLSLQFTPDSDGLTYADVSIPNSEFMNAVYRISVTAEDQEKPVARSIFRSRWIEMPVSLLNVDVAIEMLRFILEEERIEQMKEGSSARKEERFREFWKPRDPTPKTEYNELMAEYYRRIDYTYEEFSTLNTRGYNTDQGSIYIRFGPPQSIDRRFPPGEPAVEVWNYGNRSFVFRAISGFGEFKLVSN